MTKGGLVVLGLLIVLGNGLRSVIGGTVAQSKSTFSSFLSITIDATAAVTELLMGAILVSLLVAPWIMRWLKPMALAHAMVGVAAVAALGLAALFYIDPPLDMRIAAVIVLFPLLGFALATLAPISQSWTGLGGTVHSKLLLGVWSMSMPLAYLITPQVMRVVAPRYGLDGFFVGFALVAVALLGVLWLWRGRLATAHVTQQSSVHGKLLLAALGAVATFQAVTITISLAGLSSPATIPLAVLFVAACWYFWQVFTHWDKGAKRAGQPATSVVMVFVSLFLLNIATTGFYDSAYLALHACSNTLMADRATLAALSQVAAATLATVVLARREMHQVLIALGIGITVVGLALYLLYPGLFVVQFALVSEPVLLVGSRMIVGFGSGLATTAAVFALTHVEGKSGGASLMVAFVIIVGTETGLEAFEIFTQAASLLTGSTATPFGAIFLAQAAITAAALVPLVRLRMHNPVHRAAGA